METSGIKPSFNDVSVETLRHRRSLKWRRYPPDVIPMWVADMDFLPAPAVGRAVERLTAAADYGYAWRDGDAPAAALARAFAARMAERHGWEADPSHVLVVSDLVQVMFATVAAFTAPGEPVVLQTPAYPPFREAIAGLGRRVAANPLENDGESYKIDFAGLAAAAAGAPMMFLCNPQNPTGRSFSRAELARIADLACEHDLVVVSDEIHSDFIFPGSTHVPFATISAEAAARTITLTSATKSFGIAGLRCGVVHFGSAALMERFGARVHPRLLGTPSIAGIDATIAAWQGGGSWFSAVLDYLGSNRDHVVATLRREMPDARLCVPEATYLAWVDFSALRLPGGPYAFFLEEAKVALSDGASFDPACGDFARLNFATTRSILSEGLSRLIGAAAKA